MTKTGKGLINNKSLFGKFAGMSAFEKGVLIMILGIFMLVIAVYIGGYIALSDEARASRHWYDDIHTMD